MFRCGQDNCQHFRSWADPKADCCVYTFQLPQLLPREPETRKSAVEEHTSVTRKEKISKNANDKKKKTLKKEQTHSMGDRRKGKPTKETNEKNRKIPKKERKHGIDDKRKGQTTKGKNEKGKRNFRLKYA